MSKIKNGGLDQYGKVQSLNGIGGERVNGNFSRSIAYTCVSRNLACIHLQTVLSVLYFTCI